MQTWTFCLYLFLRLCLVVHVHISENSTLPSDKMLHVTLRLPGRKWRSLDVFIIRHLLVRWTACLDRLDPSISSNFRYRVLLVLYILGKTENNYEKKVFSLGQVHKKFQDGVFTLKAYQMLSFHTTPGKFENAIWLWICVWGKLGHRNHMMIVSL